MNKKITEKIISIALCVVSLLFVLLLLITTFGHIKNADLDNKIVKALLISLTVVFGILSGFSIAMSFRDTEKLSAVLIFKDKHSATKATVAVMKRTAVRVCKPIEEAKIRRVHIFADDVGNVKMKIDIKIYSDKTVDVTTKVKATLINTFEEVFGIEFSSIDFRIIKSKNEYLPNDADVEKRVEALKKEIVMNKPLPEDMEEAKIEDLEAAKADDAEEITTIEVEADDAEENTAVEVEADDAEESTTVEVEADDAEEAEVQEEATEEESETKEDSDKEEK